MSTIRSCTSCKAAFPLTATFCPYCGAGSTPEAAPFNKTLVGEMLREPSPHDTMMIEPFEDFRPGRGHGLKLLVGVAVTAAIIAGIFVGNWLADVVHRPMVAPPVAAMVAEPEANTATQLLPLITVSLSEDGFDVTRGAEIIHTVATADGSRYPSIAERMNSVAVRFKHISSKGDGRFAARLVGDHYELVWADESGDFRILDVTEEDVANSGTSADFRANLLVDRLNADLPQPNNS